MNQRFNLIIQVVLLLSYSTFSDAQKLKRTIVTHNIEYININPHTYILISYAELPGIGRIGTNHLLYIKDNKAFLFDSPYNNSLAGELYQFVKDSLRAEITMVSVSHWHWDHSGGLDTLHKLGVISYSYFKTPELMITAGLVPPQKTFPDSLIINFEGTPILLEFYGAAHTQDNIVGWIDEEKVLFSGSIIRAIDNKNLGYLKDAYVKSWPQTVENIRNRFGEAALIIPGHGDAGGPELFEHTAELAAIGQ